MTGSIQFNSQHFAFNEEIDKIFSDLPLKFNSSFKPGSESNNCNNLVSAGVAAFINDCLNSELFIIYQYNVETVAMQYFCFVLLQTVAIFEYRFEYTYLDICLNICFSFAFRI